MANNFAALVPTIFSQTLPSLRNAARACRVCRIDFKNEVAQQGNVIQFPVPVTSGTGAVTPATTPAANVDKVPGVKNFTLSNWRKSDKFTITAKERQEFDSGNFKQSQWLEQTIAVIEEMNGFALLGMKNASFRRVGTAGTIPYGVGRLQQDTIDVRKQLQIGKSPMVNRHLLLGPNSEAAALGVAAISDASLRGNQETKMSGLMGDVFGLSHWGDQQVVAHTKGTAAGALTLGTTPIIGAVGTIGSLGLKAATPGTLKQGDLLTVVTGGVTYNYVVTADVATVDTTAAGIPVAVTPALQASHAAADTWTLVASHAANIGLQQGGYGIAIRPLDVATLGLGTHITMTDPETGLAITYSEIPEYMQMSYQVSILYGHGPLRDDWLVRLLGDPLNA
jgi:hypothetical protein